MPLSRLLLLAAFFAAPLAAQTSHVVTLSGVSFSPEDLTIAAGDTVIWENVSGIHNVNGEADVYPDNPEGFSSGGAMGGSWTFTHVFTLSGDYDYHCDVHGAPGVGMIGAITVTPVSSVEDDLPAGVSLSALSPNPFREEVAFTLTAATPEPVRVAVFDARGREVDVLHDGPLPAGTPVPFVWAPATARAGVYLVRIEGATFRTTQKVVHVH
jgi:plastocyanin